MSGFPVPGQLVFHSSGDPVVLVSSSVYRIVNRTSIELVQQLNPNATEMLLTDDLELIGLRDDDEIHLYQNDSTLFKEIFSTPASKFSISPGNKLFLVSDGHQLEVYTLSNTRPSTLQLTLQSLSVNHSAIASNNQLLALTTANGTSIYQGLNQGELTPMQEIDECFRPEFRGELLLCSNEQKVQVFRLADLSSP